MDKGEKSNIRNRRYISFSVQLENRASDAPDLTNNRDFIVHRSFSSVVCCGNGISALKPLNHVQSIKDRTFQKVLDTF